MSERLVIEKALHERRARLLEILNALVELPGGDGIYQEVGGAGVLGLTREKAEELDKRFPELGIKVRGPKCMVTVASLLATVTDALCGKRLTFQVEDKGAKTITTGFGWWKDPDAPAKGSKDRGAVDFWCDACELGFGDQELNGNNCPLCGDNIVDSGDVREYTCERCGKSLRDEERKRLDPEDEVDYCGDCIEIVAHGGT